MANDASVTAYPPMIVSLGTFLIRELLCPAIEQPIAAAAAGAERRQYSRFARQLPGVLIDGDVYHSVWCVDVSYGGVKVLAPHGLDLAKGKRVLVKIKQGTRSFQDELLIVSTETTPQGTALHLAM